MAHTMETYGHAAHLDSTFAPGASSGYGHVPTVIAFKELHSQQQDNVDPSEVASVRGSNRPYVDPHSGAMVCGCGHDMGRLQWPLAAGIHHLNNRCKWTCCGASWESKTCAHDNPTNDLSNYVPWPRTRQYDFDSALDPRAAEGPGGRDAELLGALRKSKAADAAGALLDRRAAADSEDLLLRRPADDDDNSSITSAEADSEVGFGGGDFDLRSLNPTPVVMAAGEGGIAALDAVKDGALYAADLGAQLLHATLLRPFLADPVSVPADLEEILSSLLDLSVPSLADPPSCRLVAAAAAVYLRILELSDAQMVMLSSWVHSALAAWKAVRGPRQQVMFDVSATGAASLQPDGRSLLSALLHAAAVSDEALPGLTARCFRRDDLLCLKGTTFVDWFVMHKFSAVKFTVPEVTGFPLLTEAHCSALARALRARPALYAELKERRTGSAFALDRAMQPGLDFPAARVGAVAGDAEAYAVFGELYKAVILHTGALAPRSAPSASASLSLSLSPPVQAWQRGHDGRRDLNVASVTDVDSVDSLYVRGCSATGRRNLSGLSFPPHCSRAGRRRVEVLVSEALKAMQGEFTGSYAPLYACEHEPEAARPGADSPSGQQGHARDWPFGRGLFRSADGSLRVLVNGTDHLTLTVCASSLLGRTPGCEVVSVMQKFSRAVATIEHCLYQQEESTFAKSREFGFLTADPTQAGTALTLAYTLKLDRLSDPTYLLPSLCARLGLQCRPEQRGLDCNLWAVGTAHSVGLTEAEAAQVLVDGAAALIRLEKLLERGDSEGFAHAVAGLPRAFALPPVFSAPRRRDSDDDGDEEGAEVVRVAVSADDDYPVLTPAHTSLMAKHMTRELYKSLRTPEATQAAQGWSLPQLIRAGIELPGSPVGLALGSAASYEAYKHLLAPLLREYHAFRAAGPDRDAHVGDLNLAEALAPGAAGLLPRMYVRKITFSACRNLSTFPFPPSQSRKQRRMVEFLLFNAFKSLDGDLAGQYVPLHSITKTQAKILRKRSITFARPSDDADPSALCGSTRDFPDARGVFVSATGRVVGLVNGDDHLRLTVEGGAGAGELEGSAALFAKALDRVEAALQPNGFCFACSDRLGYLTSRLEDVGSGARIALSLTLPALSRQPALLLFLASSLDLAAQRDGDDGWTLTTTPTLLVSESRLLQGAAKALLAISRCEASLQGSVAPLACVAELSAFCAAAGLPSPPAGADGAGSVSASGSGRGLLPQSRQQMGALLSSHQAGAGGAFMAAPHWGPGGAALLAALVQAPLSAAEKTFYAGGPSEPPLPAPLALDATEPLTPLKPPALLHTFPDAAPSSSESALALTLEPEGGASVAEPLSPPPVPKPAPAPEPEPLSEQDLRLQEYTLAAQARLDAGEGRRTGVFVTTRALPLPASLVTNPAYTGAVAKATDPGAKAAGKLVPAFVAIDPTSQTVHMSPSRDLRQPHRCFRLADVAACTASNKVFMMVALTSVTLTFRIKGGGEAEICLPSNTDMAPETKRAWIKAVAAGLPAGVRLQDQTARG